MWSHPVVQRQTVTLLHETAMGGKRAGTLLLTSHRMMHARVHALRRIAHTTLLIAVVTLAVLLLLLLLLLLELCPSPVTAATTRRAVRPHVRT